MQINYKLIPNINIVTNGNVVKTGRQRDGKDEYVKSYSRQLGNKKTVYISTGLTNVKIIKYEGIQTNGTEYHSLPFADPTDNSAYATVCWMPNVGQIGLKTFSDRTSFTAYVDVYFTYN